MANPSNQEKRRFIRYNFPYTITIIPAQKKALSAYTEDISEGGVKVIIKEQLNMNSLVDLKIFLAQVPIAGRGKIRWVIKKENKLQEDEPIYYFDTGIEFLDLNEKDKTLLKNCVRELKNKG